MNVPVPPHRPAADPRGSLGLGIGLAWACLVGGYVFFGIVISALSQVVSSDSLLGTAVLIGLLPWVAMIALIVWMAARGYPRTAMGIGVGIASIIGVLLLLVAACFGILSGTNFH